MSPVEQIKEKLDIVEVIGQYIQLKKAGANYRANCPFHSEKTPSFYVSPIRQMWHCFGCNLGGDLFGFVMKYENIEFVEALRLLAEKAGVELKRETPETRNERTDLFELNRLAAEYFAKNLTPEARAYLNKRGLSDATIKEFGIGLAPDGDGMVAEARKFKMPENRLLASGLFWRDARSGGLRARFRSRIMFPIRDRAGRVVGFTGRIFPEDAPTNEGKYVNTPETPVFKKGEVLYGFDKAFPHVKDSGEVIVTEGQMDMLAAWEKGIRNVVAVSSAALTADQIRLLKRFARKFTLAFDNDEAGRRGSLRSALTLLGLDLEVFSARFAAKDLGEWLHKESEVPREDFLAAHFSDLRAAHGVDALHGKREILKEFLPYVKMVSGAAAKDYWVRQVADALKISEHLLFEEIARLPDERSAVAGEFSRLDPRESERAGDGSAGERLIGEDRYEALFSILCALALYRKDMQILKGVAEEILPSHLQRYNMVTGAIETGTDGNAGEDLSVLELRGQHEADTLGRGDAEVAETIRELQKEFYRRRIAEIETALRENGEDEAALTELSRAIEKLKSVL